MPLNCQVENIKPSAHFEHSLFPFQNVCKTKARQTTDAKKLVQQWVNEGYEQLDIENPQNTKKKKVVLQGTVICLIVPFS